MAIRSKRNFGVLELSFLSLIRAIGKVSQNTENIENRQGDADWSLFVNKWHCWWSASITLDNNNDVLV